MVVIGGGPGGYTAAFRLADLGVDVALVEVEPSLGGVCLHRGCIPSKSLLHVADVQAEARALSGADAVDGDIELRPAGARAYARDAVDRLARGLDALADDRGVRVVRGQAAFRDPRSLHVEDGDVDAIDFDRAIIATGSTPRALPDVPFSDRVLDSSAALWLEETPESLLVVGGGYVGLELGQVYAAFGAEVTVVEQEDRLVPAADPELVAPLAEAVADTFAAVRLGTRVEAIDERDDRVHVRLDGGDALDVDRVLVAIGRRPRSDGLELDSLEVARDDAGFVEVDAELRTSRDHVFAIGDVAGPPMLAHAAMRQGIVAAEVIAGQAAAYDPRAVPAVIYTRPQIAWCGLTRAQARAEDVDVELTTFPLSSAARAVSVHRSAGHATLITEPGTQRVLGAGFVGPQAEALIAEAVLAIEMGAVARDLASTIHAHPTLSETLAEAAHAVVSGRAIHAARSR